MQFSRWTFRARQMWLTWLGAQSPPKHRTLSSGCNGSPITDGKGIFVYFRSGRLSALDLDGSVRWTVDLAAEFGPERLYWDSGTSPVLTDDLRDPESVAPRRFLDCGIRQGDGSAALATETQLRCAERE